jgi:hypothetical protein
MSVNDASRIIIDDSRVMPQIVASLTDDSRGIIYDSNIFIVWATGLVFTKPIFKHLIIIIWLWIDVLPRKRSEAIFLVISEQLMNELGTSCE